MAQFLGQLERDWLAHRVSGTTPQKPLNQLRREYYISVVGSTSPGTRMDELERAWLREYINGEGSTPTEGADLAQLWREAVVTIGKTPTKYINGNKMIFYSELSVTNRTTDASDSVSVTEDSSVSII